MDPLTIALGLAKLTGLDAQLGRWIGGDNGAEVAKKITAMASQVTGTATPEEALKKIQLDPQLQINFSQAVMANETELERMAYADRADARAMQRAALAQQDWFAKNFIYMLTTFWSCFAAGYVTLITFTTIPQTSVRFADTILGFVLGTIIASIIAFFFGSSFTSERKAQTEQLDQLRNEFKAKV